MRVVLRVGLVGLAIVTIAGGLVATLTNPGLTDACRRAWARRAPGTAATTGRAREEVSPRIPLVSARFLDDSGYQLAGELTPMIEDRGSLEQVRSAVRVRAEQGRSALLGQLARLEARPADRTGHDL